MIIKEKKKGKSKKKKRTCSYIHRSPAARLQWRAPGCFRQVAFCNLCAFGRVAFTCVLRAARRATCSTRIVLRTGARVDFKRRCTTLPIKNKMHFRKAALCLEVKVVLRIYEQKRFFIQNICLYSFLIICRFEKYCSILSNTMKILIL